MNKPELTTEQATEKIARRIAQEQTGHEALWELFLPNAYTEYYELNKNGQEPPADTDGGANK